MSYSRAGEPLILRIGYLDIIECSLIMSTLNPEDISFCEECQENTQMDIVMEPIYNDNNTERNRNISPYETRISTENNNNIATNLQILPTATETDACNISRSLQKNQMKLPTPTASIATSQEGNQRKQITVSTYSDDLNMNDDEEIFFLEAASQCGDNFYQKENQTKNQTNKSININNAKIRVESKKRDKSQEKEEQLSQASKDDEVILQSPQLYKRRKFVSQVFERCFDKTFVTKDTIPGDTNCYILDSDENED